MSMRMLLLLPLIAVLLTSGCVVPGLEFLDFFGGPTVETETADILVIKSLSAIPATIAPAQQTRIVGYIENTGGEKIPVQRKDRTTLSAVDVELFDYCTGPFEATQITCPDTAAVRPEAGQPLACRGIALLPGQNKKINWVLKADDDIRLKTICPSEGMRISATYGYATSSITTMSIINEDELERAIEEGRVPSEESYISVGEGPLKAFLTIEDQQPISTDSQTTVIALQLRNDGEGVLTDSTVPKEKIRIIFPDTTGAAPENQIVIKPENCNFDQLNDAGSPIPSQAGTRPDAKFRVHQPRDDVTIIKGESAELLCEVYISQDVAKQATYTFTVEVEYAYEITASVKVTVEPKI